MVRPCGIVPTVLTLSKLRNSLDCDERRLSFTPLIRLPAVRMPHALDIRRFANGKITLRSLFHVQILPVH
jgi:hypothetical protein